MSRFIFNMTHNVLIKYVKNPNIIATGGLRVKITLNPLNAELNSRLESVLLADQITVIVNVRRLIKQRWLIITHLKLWFA